MAFDKNNNGVISNKNLIHALRRVGLNPTEVREDFKNKNHQTYCYFSVAKATLESQMSVHLLVTKTPQPLRIAPIDHRAYQPSSLSTIEPINHQAYRP